MLKEGEAVPELYQDPAFSRTNHWELSTSNLSSPTLDGWGYGEGIFGPLLCDSLLIVCVTVVPDGFGLSYSIGDDYIRWTITSLKRGTKEMKHYLAEAATETREMLEKAMKEQALTEGSKPKL